MICLRKEKDKDIKDLIAHVIANILKIGVSVPQLKTLMRTARFNYHEIYPSAFQRLVPLLSRKDFIEGMLDLKSYYLTLKSIFGTVIQKVLEK